MIHSSSRRRIGAALLALALAAPVSATEPRTPSKMGPREAARVFWSYVDEVLRFLSPDSWNKCGGSIDPHGGCTGQPSGGSSSTTPDSGGSADPSG
jgi:hypothetical protein